MALIWVQAVVDFTIGQYFSYIDDVQERLSGSDVVGVAQNPQTSASMYYREHRSRRVELLGRQNRTPIIDVYGAFEAYGDWSGLMADSVHPNATGQALWHSTVKAHFDAA